MTARQHALLLWLRAHPPVKQHYTVTQAGSDTYRDALKRRLAWAWLQHRVHAHRDVSSAVGTDYLNRVSGVLSSLGRLRA